MTKRYEGLNGIRALACICIVMFHVSHGPFQLSGFFFERVVASMSDLVFLFMIVSAFSMCCGYYDKIKNHEISPMEFYAKRYRKIVPFFALLCIVDLVVAPSLNSLMEAFANLTLCFGLLPVTKMSVIGVAWFIGLVCVFYLLFPFFCFCCQTRRSAWFTWFIAILFSIACKLYFFDGEHVLMPFNARTNIVYSFMFFVAGGIVYLYREPLARFSCRFRYLLLVPIAGGCVGYYCLPAYGDYWSLLTGTLILVFAIGVEKKGILNNRVTAFFGKISLEVYLCHMAAFRAIEMVGITKLFSSDVCNYLLSFVLTLAGAVAIAIGGRWLISVVEKLVVRLRKHFTSNKQKSTE